MKKLFVYILTALTLTSCFSGRRSVNSQGGEVTGAGAISYSEPTPYGMVLIDCGSMKEGPGERDSIWGIDSVARGVSVDAFWMDECEVTNSKYRQCATPSFASVLLIQHTVATTNSRLLKTSMATR